QSLIDEDLHRVVPDPAFIAFEFGDSAELGERAHQLVAGQAIVSEPRAAETGDPKEQVGQQLIAEGSAAPLCHVALVAEGLARLVDAVELRLRVVGAASYVADFRRDVPGQLALDS